MKFNLRDDIPIQCPHCKTFDFDEVIEQSVVTSASYELEGHFGFESYEYSPKVEVEKTKFYVIECDCGNLMTFHIKPTETE